MAFPTILSVAGFSLTNGTSHAVPMPATVNAGDLLLIWLARDGDSALAWNAVSGWTNKIDTDASDQGRVGLWCKVADGNEDGTTVTITPSGSPTSQGSCGFVVRIQAGTYGSGVVADVEAASVEGNSATHSPPDLSPSWGNGDTQWFCFDGVDTGRNALTYPLADNQQTVDALDSATEFAASVCSVQSATATLAPANFTSNLADQFCCATVGIRGIAAGGGGQAARTMHQQRLRRAA